MAYPAYPASALHASTDSDSLDYLVRRLTEEPEADIKNRLHRIAYEAHTHPVRQQYEREASLNYQYIENDFYTEEELAELEARGQPPTRRNEIAPIMERIAGQFIQTRQVATYLGRNTPGDDETGTVAQDWQRWNDQQNFYEFKEQEKAWHGLIGGVGWDKALITRNEMGEQVVTWKTPKPFDIYKDPFHTGFDPNDGAKYVCEASWMDLEDCIALYPDKEDELCEMLLSATAYRPYESGQVAASLRNDAFSAAIYADGMYIDRGRKRLRPFEIWYKRKVKVHYLFKPDGLLALPVPMDAKSAKRVVKELGEGVYADPIWQDRMYVGIIVGDILIHHDVSPHETNLFPYIPFYSGIRQNGCPLALTARLVPINEAINKRESKALSLFTNSKIFAEKNTIEDEEEAQVQNAKPDGIVIFKEGALSGARVKVDTNVEMGTAQFQLLQEDKDAIRRVSGQGNESMGMPSEVRSGTGIARKQAMGNLIVTPVQNNLRYSRHLKARLGFALMRQYLTAEMAFQITDDANVARTVQVTKGHLQALKSYAYDIVITEMKDYATLREQQVEMLLTAIPQLAPLGGQYVKMGIMLSELREKDTLIKMIDAGSQPPPIMPKINLAMDWKDLTPELQGFLAMQGFQSQELAQVILQKSDDPAFLQKLKVELIKAKIQEGTRAQIERGRLDVSALQTAAEGRLAMEDLMMKNLPQPPAVPGGGGQGSMEGAL